jgi:hypothetical protein
VGGVTIMVPIVIGNAGKKTTVFIRDDSLVIVTDELIGSDF